MLHPCLVVGVGGSGGRTVRYLWRELERRLARTSWSGGIPQAWSFIHVDCPANPDVVELDVPAEVGQSVKYFGAGERDIRFQVYDERLANRCPEGFAGWRPQISKPPLPWEGAGQLRTVGRIVVLDRAQGLRQTLATAAQRFGDPTVRAELADLNNTLGLDGTQAANAGPMVVVVSSLSGGSGSGAFLDVIDLVRSIGSDGQGTAWMRNNLWSVLYAPDVFKNVTPRAGIIPNSLAALSELISAAENEGAPSQSDSKLLAGGISQDDGSRLGSTTMIVGASNGKITFENQLDVFRSTAKALASLVADPGANEHFNQYVKTNSSTPNRVLPSFGLGRVGHCSSLGYSNVSLGRSLFSEYATERLAKHVLERLLEGNRQGPDAELRDEVFIDKRADELQDEFIGACRLHERGGSDNDQVIDALRAGTDVEAVLADFERQVTTRLASYPEQSEPEARKVVLKEFFNIGATTTLDQQREVLLRNARAWISEIQPHVINVVTEYVASEGLEVTEELLARLGTQMAEAADELHEEATKRRQSSDLLKREALSGKIWDKVVGRKVNANNEIFGEVSQLARKSTRADIAYEVRVLAAELIVELRSGFIQPLGRRLNEYLLGLRKQKAVHRELVGRWSTGPVPPHLIAAPNELLLESQYDHPDEYVARLQATFERKDLRVATTLAIREILMHAGARAVASAAGEPLEDDDPAACFINLQSAWSPTRLDLRDGEASQTAVPMISFGIGEIEHEARNWVRVGSGQLASYVNQTLTQWLEREANHPTFVSTLRLAVENASPLVSINRELLSRVHENTDAPLGLAMSPIPLSPGTKLGAEVLEVLSAHVPNPANLFNPTATVDTIEVTTTMVSAVHPVVMSSLVNPMRLDVASRGPQSMQEEFWFARRARQLPSFVPLPDSMQQALVRGWLTANLLGQVTTLEGRWSDGPVEVWTAEGYRRFPRQLLGPDIRRPEDVLPALFESLPLAFLTFSEGDMTESSAYRRLIELGSGPNGYGSRYTNVNPELEDWVLRGAHPEGTQPREQAIGPKDGSIEERRDALVATLEQLASTFEATVGEATPIRQGTQDAGRWELREIVPAQARQLSDTVADIPMPSSVAGNVVLNQGGL